MIPMTRTLPSASGQLLNTGGCLTVHSTRETTGSNTAVYRLWDGSNNAGQLLLTVSLGQSESTRDDFRDHHLVFKTGLYYELVSGTVEGAVGVLLNHSCEDVLAELLYAVTNSAGA